MSAGLITRHEWRRLVMQPFAWTLAAVVLAFMAWQFLLALQASAVLVVAAQQAA